jgi:hypothetical protein
MKNIVVSSKNAGNLRRFNEFGKTGPRKRNPADEKIRGAPPHRLCMHIYVSISIKMQNDPFVC